MSSRFEKLAGSVATVAILAASSAAQVTPENQIDKRPDIVSEMPETSEDETAKMPVIVVTATKKAAGQNVQDVGGAISAFGEQQLEEREFRNLENLGYSLPNVQLNAVGTVPTAANFSIRGLGVNSSIQSTEPTVGVFVDGMYLGSNIGVLFDTFDVAGVEVLRGPQGLLFGKNVTGGAVLLRTSEPSDELAISARASVESGLNYTGSGVISGPITDKLSAKIGLYYNRDEGWFENRANNDDGYGSGDTAVFRGSMKYEFEQGATTILRVETGESNQDTEPPTQNRARYDANSFDLEGGGEGYGRAEWKQAIWQTDIPVNFGNGVITNIMGYRDVDTQAQNDVDGLEEFFLDGVSIAEQEQFSNELRYSGTFGIVDVTTGIFYFNLDLLGLTGTFFGDGTNPAFDTGGGGAQTSETMAVFANTDWHVSDTVTLNFGLRYTKESKDANISSNRVGGCDVSTRTCIFDFVDSFDRDSVSPKIGLQWQPDENTHLYAFYTRGSRSGSYNFRPPANTAAAIGPTDDEVQDSYEVGFKLDFADGRARLNGALFHNELEDLQRVIIFTDPVRGPLQTFKNTADAVIQGAELEGTFLLTDALTLTAQVGMTDGYYTSVRDDLNLDGTVDERDEALQIPRLSPLTWGVGVRYTWDLPNGADLTARADFNHRDAAEVNDSNTATFSPADILDASIGWKGDNGIGVSLYGRNLLDEVTEGFISNLPATWGGPGATQAPLNKGRVIGMAVRYEY